MDQFALQDAAFNWLDQCDMTDEQRTDVGFVIGKLESFPSDYGRVLSGEDIAMLAVEYQDYLNDN